MEFTATQKRASAWLSIALISAAALWLLGPVLTPFVVAGVLAYALTPLVDRLDDLGRGRLPRFVAVVIVELLLIFALLGLALLVVPVLTKEVPLMKEQLPLLFDKLNAVIGPWLKQFGISVALDLDSLKARGLDYLSANYAGAFSSLLPSLKLGGSVALAVIGNAVLIPVALFYLLLGWKRFIALLMELVPPRTRPGVDSFADEADQVLGQYLRGQLLVMAVLALYYCVGLSLFGLDLALPIGVFTGLAIAIPYLGFGLGLLLALLAGFLEFGAHGGGYLDALVMVGVVFGAGQLMESFFLTPKLVGERIGLHPLAVIFALLAFGHILGFLGILIALPASAVLLVAVRRIQRSYLGSKLYTE